MDHHPQAMTSAQLAALLQNIINAIETGDSWEGFIEYLMPDEDTPKEYQYLVRARYRIGNADGSQGGMRFIGELR